MNDQDMDAERTIERARAYAADAWKSARDEAEARFEALMTRAERAWRNRSGGWDGSFRRPLAAIVVIGAAVGIGLYLARRKQAQPVEPETVDAV